MSVGGTLGEVIHSWCDFSQSPQVNRRSVTTIWFQLQRCSQHLISFKCMCVSVFFYLMAWQGSVILSAKCFPTQTILCVWFCMCVSTCMWNEDNAMPIWNWQWNLLCLGKSQPRVRDQLEVCPAAWAWNDDCQSDGLLEIWIRFKIIYIWNYLALEATVC